MSAPGLQARSGPLGAVWCVVLAQCLGTSLWFSPAGAAEGLSQHWQLEGSDFSWLLAATQLGFIAGSFATAWSGAADRWRASRIFLWSSLLGAALNACLVLASLSFAQAWCLRALVGVCLAGIYPLGMKLVVQWVGGRPALALAWLVAMLTLGTAMPHAVRALGLEWPWQQVLLASSWMAVFGGALVALVGDGPHQSPAGALWRLRLLDLRELLAHAPLRASALGYFGHMWELYAFWSVVPVLSAASWSQLPVLAAAGGSPSALAACVIGMGALGCVLGGYAVRRLGGAWVASLALAGSGLVCLLYPWVPSEAGGFKLVLLLLWGTLVVADSPQFSALTSQAAPARLLGAALVLQNAVGFLISVVSIVLLNAALGRWGEAALWLLLPGPVLGVLAMRSRLRAIGAN